MKENLYYVYIYLDPRYPGKYEYNNLEYCFLYKPFYVGKGKGSRWKEHCWAKPNNSYDNNKYRTRIINKVQSNLGIDPFIVITKYFENSRDAYDYEDTVIKSIGKVCTKKGPLTNISDGGGQDSDYFEKLSKDYWTKERRQRHKEINSGVNNPMYGKTIYGVWLEKYGKEEAERRKEYWLYHRELKRLHKNETPLTREEFWAIKYGKEKAKEFNKTFVGFNKKIRKSGIENKHWKHIDITKLEQLLLKDVSRKEICIQLNLINTTLGNKLKSLYNTTNLKSIKHIICEKNK